MKRIAAHYYTSYSLYMLLFCIYILLILLLFTGCRPTPKQEIVVPKDFDAMLEKARTSSEAMHVTVSSDAASAASQEAPAEEDAQDLFRMDLYGNTTAFHVTVNARVIRPEGPFPIVEVSPGDFDDESAQPFFDVLTEGYALYTAEELETKATLEHDIAEMQQFIDDGLPGFDGTAKQKKEEIKYWQKELDALKQRYLTAKDEPGTPATKVKLTWKEPAKYDTQTCGSFFVQSADKKQHFRVQTNATGAHGKRTFDNRNAFVSFYNDAVIPEGVIHAFDYADPIADMDAVPEGPGLTATPREAQQRAEALIEQLGLTDFAVSDIRLVHAPLEADGRTGVPCCLYTVSFARMVNGVPVVRPTYYSSSGDETEPRPSWHYEELAVTLRNTDLYTFEYGGPLMLGQTLAEDAALLPFDAVMERFDQMIRVKYEGILTDPGWGNIRSIEIEINRIELSLERVAQPDNIDGGLLVPVWSFYGSVLCTTPEQTFDHSRGKATPILTMNAVDGTLIDPYKGY